MMRIYLLFALLLLTGLTACHRDKTPAPKQYSTWIVNNHDTFTTNNVDSQIACNPDHSYCGAELRSMNDVQNRFALGFSLDYFPSSGQFELNTITPGNQLFGVNFYYHNQFYYHTTSRIDMVYASIVNGKPRYTMPPNWFVSYDNPTGDSILVEGVFNVP